MTVVVSPEHRPPVEGLAPGARPCRCSPGRGHGPCAGCQGRGAGPRVTLQTWPAPRRLCAASGRRGRLRPVRASVLHMHGREGRGQQVAPRLHLPLVLMRQGSPRPPTGTSSGGRACGTCFSRGNVPVASEDGLWGSPPCDTNPRGH